MQRRFLKVPEVAEILRMSEPAIRLWCKQGKLEAYKVGRDWRIPDWKVYNLVTKK